MPRRDEIEAAFCVLQTQAWVAGAEEVLRDDGFWHIEPDKDGPWHLDDAYRRGGDWSSGFTILTYGGEVVLFMSYTGYYKKEACAFLKDTLREQYEGGFFTGGRGPLMRDEDGLHYRNMLDPRGDFCLVGREEIYVDSNHPVFLMDPLGFHEYTVTVFPS